MPFGIGFEPKTFAHSFVGKKVHRWLDKVFFPIIIGGKENLIYLIQQNKDVLDFASPEARHEYRAKLRAYKHYFDEFTDEDVYSFFPDVYKGIIESYPRGEEWAFRQITAIRQVLES